MSEPFAYWSNPKSDPDRMWRELTRLRDMHDLAQRDNAQLKRELEASRQREARALDDALEEAATILRRYRDEAVPDEMRQEHADAARALEFAFSHAEQTIRALKSNHESKDTLGGA